MSLTPKELGFGDLRLTFVQLRVQRRRVVGSVVVLAHNDEALVARLRWRR
jgi:hypothetical protein